MNFSIYFVRHGQTVSNRDGILQGQSDSDLTAQGIEDAISAGHLLRGIDWTLFVSSDLGRAFSTANHLKSAAGIQNDIASSILAREICFGIRNGLPVGLSVQQAKERVGASKGVDPYSIVDDAETTADVLRRQFELLFEISHLLTESSYPAPELPEHRLVHGAYPTRVLLVSHGGFIRAFLQNHCGIRCESKIRNGSVSVVNVHKLDDGTFQCQAHETFINYLDA